MENTAKDTAASTLTPDARKFMVRVFLLMFIGLAITSACIYAFNTYNYCMRLLFVNDSITAFTWLSLIGPFVISFIIRKGVNAMSYTALCLLFIIYAALIGVCFSFVLIDFVDGSLFSVFITACVAFGVMGIIGFTTRIDLTNARPILYWLLGGLIVVTPIVFLFPDLDMSLWVSYVGVIIFMGLGAFHFEDLRDTADQPGIDDVSAKKIAILCSLQLYIDFVNLFFFLVALFFKRK